MTTTATAATATAEAETPFKEEAKVSATTSNIKEEETGPEPGESAAAEPSSETC
jgi:hypothetical protein